MLPIKIAFVKLSFQFLSLTLPQNIPGKEEQGETDGLGLTG